jgi:excisionase family DNA binding protein
MGDDTNQPLVPAAGDAHRPDAGVPEPDLLTVTEVARLLRVSKMTIYRLIEDGQLPALRIGRSFRIHHGTVTQFMTITDHNAGAGGPAARRRG